MFCRVFSQSVRILEVFQCVPGLRRQARSQQAGQERRQTRTGCSVKVLPSLLNGWVKFLTATSAPVCWKLHTATNPVHFKAFVLQTVCLLKPRRHISTFTVWREFYGLNLWDNKRYLKCVHRSYTYCSLIHLNFFFPKVRHLLERVDGDEHRTDICLMRLYIKDHTRKTNKSAKNKWHQTKITSYWKCKSCVWIAKHL